MSKLGAGFQLATVTPPVGKLVSTWLANNALGFNPRDEAPSGNIGDGVSDATDFIGASDAKGPVLFTRGAYRVSRNTTIANPVRFMAGAMLKPDNGVTVKLIGGMVAEPGRQIFDLSAGGSVVFGSAPNQWATQAVVVNPDMWGLHGSVAPYDTAAVQAAVDSLAPVVFLRNYWVDTVTISSSLQSVDFGPFKLIGMAAVARAAVLIIKTYMSDFYNTHIDANFNTHYDCALKVVADAGHTNGGQFNQYFGVTVENAIRGVIFGELPGVAAYNAPLSETTIHGFRTRATQIGVIVNQPNGKVTFTGSHSVPTPNEWPAVAPGVYDNAASVALWVPPSTAGGTKGGSEVAWIGGSLENNDPASTGYGIRGANMKISGAIFECIGSNLVEDDGIIIVDNLNALSGIVNSAPAFTIAAGATGSLKLVRCKAQRTIGSGWPLVDSAAAPNFITEFDSCDVSGWIWEHNATNGWAPLVNRGRVNFKGQTRFRNFGVAGVPTVDVYVGQSLLSDNIATMVDTCGDTIAAVADQTTKGGWTFSTGGDANNKFGSSADVPNASYTASIDLISKVAAAQSAAITGPIGTNAMRVKPSTTVIVRAWLKPVANAGGVGQFIMRLQWYKFSGAASATVSTDLCSAQLTTLGWAVGTWIPVTFRATVPTDAAFAAPFIYADSGLEMRITDYQVK